MYLTNANRRKRPVNGARSATHASRMPVAGLVLVLMLSLTLQSMALRVVQEIRVELDELNPVPGWTQNAELPMFNPADHPYRSLQRVDIELTGVIGGTFGFENLDNAGTSTFEFDYEVLFELLDPDSAVVADVTPRFEYETIVDTYDGNEDWDGPSGETFYPDASDSALKTYEIDGEGVDPFVGTGALTFTVVANGPLAVLTNWQSTGEKDRSLNEVATADAYIDLRYYVPEPATLALLSMSALALLLRRK